ncbi:LLM class flavin-dependent oxidoreductase [Corynebacterium sp. TAE3-ERU12]|uniref:LLM class flavin-dependent oxidoreductase n=1 Tax=Corynebacterium sp. TAE3-ERU12 TaxID=2849491 RepID=UPI001C46A73A|nr:LLM class flavin-dependent oxidoreductase [Corynebacterium sp. TAE3-ERU12]MBV7296104.1 LLM class flavin-dependent oxidoreductase [Corynebacterium sp. TAE3-ERU12]
MTARRVPLSVLDLAPVSEGSEPADAIGATLGAAQAADHAGYRRFWIAEHHNTIGVASSATAVLVGQIAGNTERIRVGSGGVMLPNHVPLRVAEDYGTLATIYPDRIDLGVGRAPGTDPATAQELQRGGSDIHEFVANIRQLHNYLGPAQPGAPIIACPGQGTNVPIYVLGSSAAGATVAAAMGLPLAMAAHFAPFQLAEALEIYRDQFNPDAPTAQVDQPYVMVGVNTLVADTAAEARYQFSVTEQMFILLRKRGGRAKLPPPTRTPYDMTSDRGRQALQASLRCSFVGTEEMVVDGLAQFADDTGADEFITVTYAHDPQVRHESIARLGQVWHAQ